MVGSCDVKFPIQLEGLCVTHAQFSTYEPELFPGLIYRMVRPHVVLLVLLFSFDMVKNCSYHVSAIVSIDRVYLV